MINSEEVLEIYLQFKQDGFIVNNNVSYFQLRELTKETDETKLSEFINIYKNFNNDAIKEEVRVVYGEDRLIALFIVALANDKTSQITLGGFL